MGDMIGVLSDREIKKEIKDGNIILYDPDNECMQNIQNSSVDFTLGEFYYRNTTRVDVVNPWCKSHVDDYWGKCRTASIVETEEEAKKFSLSIGSRYIYLEPKESILGHTREFIGGRNFITTMVKARSSLGRNNVTVCRDAGWGDVNFVSRWTLEITNNGSCPIILPVGGRIGQIIFFYTGKPDSCYKGKYQTSDDISEITKSWNPSMMLPKLHLDDNSPLAL